MSFKYNTKVTNIAIKRILERSVEYNPKNWSEKLDDALWAFRTAYKTPTGCTPFRLVYGKACHLPVEIKHRAYWALKQCNMDLTAAAKNHFMELNELMKLRDRVYENTRIYKERTKKWHDSRLQGIKTIRYRDRILHVFPIFCTGPRCKEIDEVVIMEYLVKDSKKARILELKRRHFKITVLTSYTPYSSRKDMAYLCLQSPPTDHHGTRSNSRILLCLRAFVYEQLTFGVQYLLEQIIMEYLVNISKRRAFWSLNEDILKMNLFLTTIPLSIIKEDTAYPCLHSLNTTKETSLICRIQERQYVVFKLYENKKYSGRYQSEFLTPRKHQYAYPIP
ncbi:reverse transcriptase domain-containing protein [Tanacetum coccineum]